MKKNFIIYAPAINSKTGGAHSILVNFLSSIKHFDSPALQEASWSFVGNAQYKSLCAESSIVHQELDLNKKWILRILYDRFLFRKYFLKNDPSIIISMQNTTPRSRLQDKAITYVHQAIPFIDNYRPNPFKHLTLFLIKYFYSIFIQLGVEEKKTFFIVQSEWLKEKCARKLNLPTDHFVIHRPLPSDIDTQKYTLNKKKTEVFFYPSLYQDYKNHQRLCEAFSLAAKENPELNFELSLTINPFDMVFPKNLKVEFLGMIPRTEALERINNAKAVVFPSLLESYGMPLAEALFLNTPIIASDLGYVRELVGAAGHYFNPYDIQSMKEVIVQFKKGAIIEPKIENDKFQTWENILENLLNKMKQ